MVNVNKDDKNNASTNKEIDSSEGTKRNSITNNTTKKNKPLPPPASTKPLLQLTKGGKNANKHLNIPKTIRNGNTKSMTKDSVDATAAVTTSKQSMRLSQAKRAEAEAKRAHERQNMLKQNKSLMASFILH